MGRRHRHLQSLLGVLRHRPLRARRLCRRLHRSRRRGVLASRFGAGVALDLLDGRASEATASRYVSTRPLPFPPEPLRSLGFVS